MKLNDVIIGSASVNEEGYQLNKKQLSQLTKDQIAGRAPVMIRGIKGYVGGDGVWQSERHINKLKKGFNTLHKQIKNKIVK